MKTRKTKQNQIDELKIQLESKNSWSDKKLLDAEKHAQKLQEENLTLRGNEMSIRGEITEALGMVNHNNPCNPSLSWPQIYIEIGKLIQIKETVNPKPKGIFDEYKAEDFAPQITRGFCRPLTNTK